MRGEKRSDRSFIIIVILINDVNGSNKRAAGGQQPFSGKSHPLKIAAVGKLEHKGAAATALKENDYNHDHDNDVHSTFT